TNLQHTSPAFQIFIFTYRQFQFTDPSAFSESFSLATAKALYCVGDIPCHLVNTRVKELSFLYPHSIAISFTGSSVSLSCPRALSIRSWHIKACTVISNS